MIIEPVTQPDLLRELAALRAAREQYAKQGDRKALAACMQSIAELLITIEETKTNEQPNP